MPLDFSLTDNLREIIRKIARKDPGRAQFIRKKILQIVSSDENTIQHYKNLRHDLKNLKRVHIDSSFVLTFSYDASKRFILFIDFDHHDRIYKRG